MIRSFTAMVTVALVATIGCDDLPTGPDGGTDADILADADAQDADTVDADVPPCPEEMVFIDDDEGTPFCIDEYEHPGVGGVMPTIGVAWYEASETCTAEAKMMCTEDQWARACVGTIVESCEGSIGPSGHRPECVSALGVYDLAGNVAEWTASPGGSVTFWVRGGSGEEEDIGCDLREEFDAERRRTDLGVRCCRRPR